MNLLVTGGAGYIGSHFCKLAAGHGHTVVSYDNLSTGRARFAKFGPFIEGDLRDIELLHKTLTSRRIDAVIHFAGKALVRESTQKPEIYYDNNPYGTLCLLQAMMTAHVKKIVFSSSCAVYGAHAGPITEAAEQRPINPYGQSKKHCEEILFDFQKRHGFHIAVLRYFNVIGQDESDELYEDHEPETHILPNILRAEAAGRAVPILGDRHPTADGTCIRDFVDVRDLVKAHLVALGLLDKTPLFISNIARGAGVSLKELIAAYGRVFKTSVKSEIQPSHPGDPPVLVAAADFFRTWYPQNLFSLEESIQSLAKRREALLSR